MRAWEGMIGAERLLEVMGRGKNDCIMRDLVGPLDVDFVMLEE